MSLSFKEVDPSVLGPKYKKVKVEEPGKKSNFFKADPETTKKVIDGLEKELNKELTDKGITDVKDAKKLIDEKVFGITPLEPVSVPSILKEQDPRIPIPCPFCGSEAKIRTGIPSMGYENSRMAHAKCYCTKCGANGPVFLDEEHDGSFVFNAIDAWNRRV